MKHKIFLLVIGSVVMFTALPVYAWRAAAATANSTGVAYGRNGGSAAWSNGAGVAYGKNGGSAAWNHGNAVATGPNGNTVAKSYSAPAYGYRPPAPAYGYRPPAYYGNNYGYSSGQVAAAGVAGLAVGAMAGSAASKNQQSSTVVVQQPAQPSTSLVVGSTLSALPNGCSSVNYQSSQYYQCGTSWLKAYFGGSGAYYQVVAAPY